MTTIEHKPTHTPAAAGDSGMDKKPKNRKPVLKIIVIVLGIILLLLGSFYLGYWYRGINAKTELDKANQQINELQQQKQEAEDAKNKLQTELDELKASKTTTTTNSNVPTAAVKANIEDSIKSGNTAALEGYMASTVKVIIAASEGIGNRTPAQAVGDLEYLESGTDPWNFSLPAATLAAWRSGPYKQYFPANAVVGKSANNYVVSFSFDNSGKINTVFMAVNADLLTS